MKKAIIWSLAVLSLGAASCNKDTKSELKSTVSTFAYTLAVNPHGETAVSLSEYVLNAEAYSSTVMISATNVGLGGATPVSFKTNTMPYGSGTAKIGSFTAAVTYFKGADVTLDNGPQITDMEGMLTLASLTNDPDLIPNLKTVLTETPLLTPLKAYPCSYLCMEYKYNDWHMYTFWNDLLFEGNTTTQYPGIEEPYSNKEITYRVRLNLEKAGEYKADVYMYNAKFTAKPMPTINIVLKDLPVEFKKDGEYSIIAKDVVPTMIPEGTPNPNFPFKNFRLVSNNKMKGVSCIFDVAERYSGSFSGTGIASVK